MENIFYDLRHEIEMLKEDGSATGFMRTRINVFDSDTAVVPNFVGQIGSASETKNKIKQILTVAEYEALNKTTYQSSKKTIKEYICLLTKLLDAGVFDACPENNQIPNFPAPPFTNTPESVEKSHGDFDGDKCKCDNDKKCCDCREAKVKESVDRSNTVYEGPYIHISLADFENPNDILTKLHEELVGNDKYINCSIILSKDDLEYSVDLCVDELDSKDLRDVFTIINNVIKKK